LELALAQARAPSLPRNCGAVRGPLCACRAAAHRSSGGQHRSTAHACVRYALWGGLGGADPYPRGARSHTLGDARPCGRAQCAPGRVRRELHFPCVPQRCSGEPQAMQTRAKKRSGTRQRPDARGDGSAGQPAGQRGALSALAPPRGQAAPAGALRVRRSQPLTLTGLAGPPTSSSAKVRQQMGAQSTPTAACTRRLRVCGDACCAQRTCPSRRRPCSTCLHASPSSGWIPRTLWAAVMPPRSRRGWVGRSTTRCGCGSRLQWRRTAALLTEFVTAQVHRLLNKQEAQLCAGGESPGPAAGRGRALRRL